MIVGLQRNPQMEAASLQVKHAMYHTWSPFRDKWQEDGVRTQWSAIPFWVLSDCCFDVFFCVKRDSHCSSTRRHVKLRWADKPENASPATFSVRRSNCPLFYAVLRFNVVPFFFVFAAKLRRVPHAGFPTWLLLLLNVITHSPHQDPPRFVNNKQSVPDASKKMMQEPPRWVIQPQIHTDALPFSFHQISLPFAVVFSVHTCVFTHVHVSRTNCRNVMKWLRHWSIWSISCWKVTCKRGIIKDKKKGNPLV